MGLVADTSAIVLVFDGLNPSGLGPYGNTWNPTPTFNQLAAESYLVEHAMADDPRPASTSRLRSLRGMWDGRHVMCPRQPTDCGQLIRQCAAQGICATLVCDDAEVAKYSGEIGFARIRTLPQQGPATPAIDEFATRFGQLIAAAIDELVEMPSRSLLWIQASTLLHAWDAPSQLCAELLDEDDPHPPEQLPAPHIELDSQVDPDLAWGWSVRYAAELRAIDACLAVLLSAVHEAPQVSAPLLLLTATHGYPLGEHHIVGLAENSSLHSELVHVPHFVRYPDGYRAMQRDQRLCQSATVYSTLAEWLEMAPSSTNLGAYSLSGPSATRAVAQLGDQWALRTPAWYALVQGDIEQGDIQMYVKPDDRFDFNDVSQLCVDEAQSIRHELTEFAAAAQREQLDSLPPLPDELCLTMR